jgi:hypothetical protein
MSTAWSAPTPEPGDHRAILGIRAGQLKSDVQAPDKLLTLTRSFTYSAPGICVPPRSKSRGPPGRLPAN